MSWLYSRMVMPNKMSEIKTALPAANAVMSTGVWDSMTCKASLAFRSPCCASTANVSFGCFAQIHEDIKPTVDLDACNESVDCRRASRLTAWATPSRSHRRSETSERKKADG